MKKKLLILISPIIWFFALLYRIVAMFLSYALIGLALLCLFAICAELFNYGFTKETAAYFVLGTISIAVRFGLILSIGIVMAFSDRIQIIAQLLTIDQYDTFGNPLHRKSCNIRRYFYVCNEETIDQSDDQAYANTDQNTDHHILCRAHYQCSNIGIFTQWQYGCSGALGLQFFANQQPSNSKQSLQYVLPCEICFHAIHFVDGSSPNSFPFKKPFKKPSMLPILQSDSALSNLCSNIVIQCIFENVNLMDAPDILRV